MRITDKEAKRLGLSEFVPKRKGRPKGKMTHTEKRYARDLDAEQLAGENEGWEYEPDVLELGPDCSFLPDFKVWIDRQNEVYEYREIKGDGVAEKFPDGVIKAKWAAVRYPETRFWLITWSKSRRCWIKRLMKSHKE